MESSPLLQRALIIGSNSVFEDGMAHLLTSAAGMEVETVKYADNVWFLDAAMHDQPDVIVLVDTEILNFPRLLRSLFSIPVLKNLCIIVVRLTDNLVDVYELPKQIGGEAICVQRQINITNRDEFVAIARGDFDHNQNRDFSLFSVLKEI